MRDKKIIYVLNSYSSDEASHFFHILNLLEVMASKGCDVVLIIEKFSDGLPVMRHPRIKVVGISATNRLTRYIRLFLAVSSWLQKGYRVTFVRISAVSAIVCSVANGLIGGKCYLWQSGTTHDVDWAQPASLKKLKWIVASYVPNWIARRVVQRFVTGPESMVDYYSNVVGVNRKKIRLLYNDVDLSRFDNIGKVKRNSEYLDKYNIELVGTVFLLVHRLSPVRRTLFYLEKILQKMGGQRDDWTLIIVGGGSEVAPAMEMVSRFDLDKNVRFLGEIPNSKISELYSVADIFINPTYTEGFPRVLIEAMAAGLPIVTTDAGGASEILPMQQHKYLSSKDDPEAFAKNMYNLMHSAEAWSDLSKVNVKAVERFSTENVADMYIRTLFE